MKQRIVRHHPKQHSRPYKQEAILSLIVFIVAFVPTILFAQYTHANELQVWFFDVGQGDATFIETPEGKQILIDGGPDKTILSKLSSVMWPWDRSIDVLIITHPDADHITGLVDVLERYDVGMIIQTDARGFTPVSKALDQRIQQEGAEVRVVNQGDTFVFGELAIEVLWPIKGYQRAHPKERNNVSIVTQLTFGETTILITGDAEKEVEAALLDRVDVVDVLKVGHHGSITSSTVPFLKKIKPEFAIISSGETNRYGHPHPVVLSRLQAIGATVYRNDLDGDVLLSSDGGEPRVAPNPLPF